MINIDFSEFCRVGSPKSRGRFGRFGVWWDLTSWFTGGHLSAVSSHGWRSWRAPWGSLLWGHSSHSWGLHPHGLVTSQTPYLLIPLHRGLGINIWILWGHKRSVRNTMLRCLEFAREVLGSCWRILNRERQDCIGAPRILLWVGSGSEAQI